MKILIPLTTAFQTLTLAELYKIVELEAARTCQKALKIHNTEAEKNKMKELAPLHDSIQRALVDARNEVLDKVEYMTLLNKKKGKVSSSCN